MDIDEYKDYYKIPLGTKVIIKDCHSRPEIVGKTGKVIGWVDTETTGYPLMVVLAEPVYIPLAGMPLAMPFQGPHYCRPDELTVVGEGDVPEVFNFEDTGGKPDDSGDQPKG